MKKAEVAMQFLVMVGIVFIFFVTFVVALAGYYKDILKEKETVAIRDITLTIHDEIMIAYNLQDGYERSFTIPDKVENFNFSISIVQNVLSTTSENAEYSTQIVPVQGQLRRGLNVIRKQGGEVWLN